MRTPRKSEYPGWPALCVGGRQRSVTGANLDTGRATT